MEPAFHHKEDRHPCGGFGLGRAARALLANDRRPSRRAWGRQTSRPPPAEVRAEHRGRQTQSPRKCCHRQTPHDGRESDQGADCCAAHSPRTAHFVDGRRAAPPGRTWQPSPQGSARLPLTHAQKSPQTPSMLLSARNSINQMIPRGRQGCGSFAASVRPMVRNPVIAEGSHGMAGSVCPDKTCQNKPVPFWQVG